MYHFDLHRQLEGVYLSYSLLPKNTTMIMDLTLMTPSIGI